MLNSTYDYTPVGRLDTTSLERNDRHLPSRGWVGGFRIAAMLVLAAIVAGAWYLPLYPHEAANIRLIALHEKSDAIDTDMLVREFNLPSQAGTTMHAAQRTQRNGVIF